MSDASTPDASTPDAGTPDPAAPRTAVPRSIELDIEVPGTPEQVWQAIATGPGISSWYVPHVVEERAGGDANASFGPGMDVPGRVAVWEPPHRVVFDGGEGVGGLAFEWLVEARDGGSCVVRLVNTGFGDGGPWDAQYDDMVGGWKLFLFNLKAHLTHFAGRPGAAALPMAMWSLPPDAAWQALTGALGLPAEPAVGDRVAAAGGPGPFAGTVLDAGPRRLALLLDEPAPGTAIVAAEGGPDGPGCGLSVWAYLYGDDRDALAEKHFGAWTQWLAEHAPGGAAPA